MKKIIFFISFTLIPFLALSDDEERGGIEEVIVTAEGKHLLFKILPFL